MCSQIFIWQLYFGNHLLGSKKKSVTSLYVDPSKEIRVAIIKKAKYNRAKLIKMG